MSARQPQTLCLNMIVKDEAHVIEATLTHLLTVFPITYWVIDDTGSTDGTQDLIRGFFAARGISGELFETPWRNFGYNRTQAFAHAFNKTDYVLVWDADDSVVGALRLPTPLTADWYQLVFGDEGGFRYQRPQLFNNRKRWNYVGVLHEYAACLETAGAPSDINGDYYCVSGKTGARSKDPDKYRKDAAVLEKGLLDEPDNARYAFYCANSYKDAGDPENAIRMYKKVLTMNGWADEKYLACIRIYDLSQNPANLHYLVESHRYCPERVEGIKNLVQHYTVAGGMDDVALAYYGLVQEFYENRYDGRDTAKHLFVAKADFDYFLPYHTIIAAIRRQRWDLAATLYDRIFRHGHTTAGAWWNNCLFHNLLLVAPHLKPDLAFLHRLLAFRAALPYRLNDVPNKAIAAVIDRHRDLLGAPLTEEVDGPPRLMIQDRAAPRVLLTITTCKRLDLFTRTVNSMLRTWTDLDAVDAFLCVDDNSSEEDRAAMRATYPFFEFYMKTPAERGHRQSMNIIWERLRTVRPTYWVHLEDDWLFFKRGSYVRDPIAILERPAATTANVHQLLYNRNYAELYSDGWGINGGAPLEPGVLLHQKADGIPGRNCGYWPHYSFRPSVVRVDPILTLGNYDSPNTFFERDYADRWFAAGHRSAFYDDIRCLHIGRLTSERDNSTAQNAYTLNGTSQFVTAPKRFVHVVNLVRRPDRRESVRATFAAAGWSDSSGDYAIYEAVDGSVIQATPEIAHLFAGNDFGSRRGFIGCALSHYRIWQELAAAPAGSTALVFEDDITIPDPSGFCGHIAAAETRLREKSLELVFLGHTCWNEADRITAPPDPCGFAPLDRSKYVGGTFGYVISQAGAKRYLEYIQKNGIGYGIDYLLKRISDMKCEVAAPHIVLSEWARTPAQDSDIQSSQDSLDLSAGEWVFFQGLDHIGDDIRCAGRKSATLLTAEAVATDTCVAVNSLGFLKSAVRFPLSPSQWFGPRDGIWIKRSSL